MRLSVVGASASVHFAFFLQHPTQRYASTSHAPLGLVDYLYGACLTLALQLAGISGRESWIRSAHLDGWPTGGRHEAVVAVTRAARAGPSRGSN